MTKFTVRPIRVCYLLLLSILAVKWYGVGAFLLLFEVS